MTSSQFIISSLILFIFWKTIFAYKRGSLTKTFTIPWLALWITIFLVLFQQNLLTSTAHLIGIGRGVDLAIYISVIIIFYLIFRVFVELSLINRKITKILREDALKKYKK
jgi:hypothetical protein